VLGVDVGDEATLPLDGSGSVRFVPAADERSEGLVEIALELPREVRHERDAVEVGGVRLLLGDADQQQGARQVASA
jgi:hypothetical protein